MKIAMFIVGSAAAYSIAMILMKFWHVGADTSRLVLGILIALTVFYAVFLEIEALRSERLGMIYVAILGVECLLITCASIFWFDEDFSMKEAAGMLLIVAGTAMTWG